MEINQSDEIILDDDFVLDSVKSPEYYSEKEEKKIIVNLSSKTYPCNIRGKKSDVSSKIIDFLGINIFNLPTTDGYYFIDTDPFYFDTIAKIISAFKYDIREIQENVNELNLGTEILREMENFGLLTSVQIIKMKINNYQSSKNKNVSLIRIDINEKDFILTSNETLSHSKTLSRFHNSGDIRGVKLQTFNHVINLLHHGYLTIHDKDVFDVSRKLGIDVESVEEDYNELDIIPAPEFFDSHSISEIYKNGLSLFQNMIPPISIINPLFINKMHSIRGYLEPLDKNKVIFGCDYNYNMKTDFNYGTITNIHIDVSVDASDNVMEFAELKFKGINDSIKTIKLTDCTSICKKIQILHSKNLIPAKRITYNCAFPPYIPLKKIPILRISTKDGKGTLLNILPEVEYVRTAFPMQGEYYYEQSDKPTPDTTGSKIKNTHFSLKPGFLIKAEFNKKIIDATIYYNKKSAINILPINNVIYFSNENDNLGFCSQDCTIVVRSLSADLNGTFWYKEFYSF